VIKSCGLRVASSGLNPALLSVADATGLDAWKKSFWEAQDRDKWGNKWGKDDPAHGIPPPMPDKIAGPGGLTFPDPPVMDPPSDQ
jgi:hypothetical protein